MSAIPVAMSKASLLADPKSTSFTEVASGTSVTCYNATYNTIHVHHTQRRLKERHADVQLNHRETYQK
jgi:hypothetical protein